MDKNQENLCTKAVRLINLYDAVAECSGEITRQQPPTSLQNINSVNENNSIANDNHESKTVQNSAFMKNTCETKRIRKSKDLSNIKKKIKKQYKHFLIQNQENLLTQKVRLISNLYDAIVECSGGSTHQHPTEPLQNITSANENHTNRSVSAVRKNLKSKSKTKSLDKYLAEKLCQNFNSSTSGHNLESTTSDLCQTIQQYVGNAKSPKENLQRQNPNKNAQIGKNIPEHYSSSSNCVQNLDLKFPKYHPRVPENITAITNESDASSFNVDLVQNCDQLLRLYGDNFQTQNLNESCFQPLMQYDGLNYISDKYVTSSSSELNFRVIEDTTANDSKASSLVLSLDQPFIEPIMNFNNSDFQTQNLNRSCLQQELQDHDGPFSGENLNVNYIEFDFIPENIILTNESNANYFAFDLDQNFNELMLSNSNPLLTRSCLQQKLQHENPNPLPCEYFNELDFKILENIVMTNASSFGIDLDQNFKKLLLNNSNPQTENLNKSYPQELLKNGSCSSYYTQNLNLSSPKLNSRVFEDLTNESNLVSDSDQIFNELMMNYNNSSNPFSDHYLNLCLEQFDSKLFDNITITGESEAGSSIHDSSQIFNKYNKSNPQTENLNRSFRQQNDSFGHFSSQNLNLSCPKFEFRVLENMTIINESNASSHGHNLNLQLNNSSTLNRLEFQKQNLNRIENRPKYSRFFVSEISQNAQPKMRVLQNIAVKKKNPERWSLPDINNRVKSNPLITQKNDDVGFKSNTAELTRRQNKKRKQNSFSTSEVRLEESKRKIKRKKTNSKK